MASPLSSQTCIRISIGTVRASGLLRDEVGGRLIAREQPEPAGRQKK